MIAWLASQLFSRRFGRAHWASRAAGPARLKPTFRLVVSPRRCSSFCASVPLSTTIAAINMSARRPVNKRHDDADIERTGSASELAADADERPHCANSGPSNPAIQQASERKQASEPADRPGFGRKVANVARREHARPPTTKLAREQQQALANGHMDNKRHGRASEKIEQTKRRERTKRIRA